MATLRSPRRPPILAPFVTVGSITRFPERMPGAKVATLGKNWRSTAPLVAASSGFIARNRERVKQKRLFSDRKEGIGPVIVASKGKKGQAARAAEVVLDLKKPGRISRAWER